MNLVVSQVSNDGGFTQVLLETKPSKWRSNEKISISLAVLNVIKIGQNFFMHHDNERKHLQESQPMECNGIYNTYSDPEIRNAKFKGR